MKEPSVETKRIKTVDEATGIINEAIFKFSKKELNIEVVGAVYRTIEALFSTQQAQMRDKTEGHGIYQITSLEYILLEDLLQGDIETYENNKDFDISNITTLLAKIMCLKAGQEEREEADVLALTEGKE